MPKITKQEIIESMQRLPEDANVTDAIYRLYVLHKIEIGLTEIEDGEGIPHEAIERDFRKEMLKPNDR